MLQEQESNKLNSFILQSLDGFFDWSIVSGNVSISQSLKELLGFGKNDLICVNSSFFLDQVFENDVEFVQSELHGFFSSYKEKLHIEFRLLNKEKQPLWVSVIGILQRDSNGKPLRLIGVVTNIDPYKKELEFTVKSSDSKSKFIASLNHELRSPLASIISTANYMLEDDLNEQHKLYVQNIISSADMLMNLVNDVLDVSKITAGKLILEKTPVSLREIIDHVQEILKPQYTKKKLFFEKSIDKSVPQYIKGDSTRIKQILLNLCTNAIKFTKSGGIYLNTKYTKIDRLSGKLYIEVLDTGIGIPSDRIGNLFQDYNQADITTTRQYGGTGLGLSICKRLINLMGGEISVSSKENMGSTFWFEIPAELPDFDEIPQQNTYTTKNTQTKLDHKGSSSELKLEEPKGGYMQSVTAQFLDILVAEDNMVNQAVIKGLLEKLGHKVTVANNGQEAVDQAHDKEYDIILMDINMPVMDGITACQEIRKFNPHIPIIAVTANTLDEGKQSCLAAGMNGFATKPVDKQKLNDLLAPYLQVKYSSEAFSQPAKEPRANTAINSEILYVDTNSLQQLISDLGSDRIQKFIEMYKKDAPKLIENLNNQIELEHSAHTLAGMSENLSFTALGKKSRLLLAKIRQDQIDEMFKAEVIELPNIYEKTLAQVENVLSQS